MNSQSTPRDSEPVTTTNTSGQPAETVPGGAVGERGTGRVAAFIRLVERARSASFPRLAAIAGLSWVTHALVVAGDCTIPRGVVTAVLCAMLLVLGGADRVGTWPSDAQPRRGR